MSLNVAYKRPKFDIKQPNPLFVTNQNFQLTSMPLDERVKRPVQTGWYQFFGITRNISLVLNRRNSVSDKNLVRI